MSNILDLNAKETRSYFLKKESYSSIELPYYFNFQNLLKEVSEILSEQSLSSIRKETPRNFDDVNYQLVSNKDGKYAWRPFQLIHPAIYVSLVNNITDEKNWDFIKKRFEQFQKEKRIECHSLPVISESKEKSDKSYQILNWWKTIEQRSIKLSLDYRYVIHSDITDCYGSIYTHSISWALHTKKKAKKRKNRNNNSLIEVVIDKHLQDMSHGQTNGIPQGSTLMDFISEIVLGYMDLKLAKKLSTIGVEDYKILRYRDDYRIFSNESFEAERITKELSEIALRNPRVTPSVIAILSIFINRLPIKKDKLNIAHKIKLKFNQIPNSSFMMVWYQRLNLKINKTEEYELPLCKKVVGSKKKVWNCEWLEGNIKKSIDQTNIVDRFKVKKARTKLFKKEINKIINSKKY